MGVDLNERDRLSAITVNLGLFSNVILSILKTTVGIVGHSPALLADGINSSSDVIYYVAVKFFMVQARKPADEEHPYGHRQLESIASIVVGAFILTTGIAIFWDSINKVYELASGSATSQSSSLWALVIAVGTLILKLFLYNYTRRSTKQTGNPTLRALTNDHFNDIMASVAVIFGLIMGKLGFLWMDPAAGAVVAIYIIKTGFEILKDSSSDLMDSVPDPEFKQKVTELAMGVSGVLGIEELGLHRFGPHFLINITICVDGALSVSCGHDISEEVEKELFAYYGNSLSKVNIHYHPHKDTRSESCLTEIKP